MLNWGAGSELCWEYVINIILSHESYTVLVGTKWLLTKTFSVEIVFIILGWTQTHYVIEDGFELPVLLPPPPKCQDLLYGGLGMNPRASYMLDKHWTKWATSPAHNKDLFSKLNSLRAQELRNVQDLKQIKFIILPRCLKSVVTSWVIAITRWRTKCEIPMDT